MAVFEKPLGDLTPVIAAATHRQIALVGLGLVGTFAPCLFRLMPAPLQAASMVAGAAGAAGAALNVQSSDRQRRLYSALQALGREELQSQIAGIAAQAQVEQAIGRQQRHAIWVAENLPPDQWHQAAALNGANWLFPAPAPPHAAAMSAGQGAEEAMMVSGGFATSAELPREDLDTGWLTPKFARSSKIVAAERGAGKSHYLRWEVAQLRQHYPEAIVCFVDPHLRVSQMEAGGQSVWLSVSAQEEQDLIVHKPAKARQELEKIYGVVRRRLQGDEPVDRLVKVIIDEADADFWNEDGAGDSLKKLLKIVANEARKANVEITLVAHSLKKNTTGFDAAHLSQISWLMLGGILGSPDIHWPNDLDPKRWAQERELMQVALDDSVGRACVLRERGEGRSSIRVVVMPRG